MSKKNATSAKNLAAAKSYMWTLRDSAKNNQTNQYWARYDLRVEAYTCKTSIGGIVRDQYEAIRILAALFDKEEGL